MGPYSKLILVSISSEPNLSADAPKESEQKTALSLQEMQKNCGLGGIKMLLAMCLPGEGETSFEWHKRKSGNPFINRFQEQECSSFFVEPLKWMTSVKDGALEGKLSCIHCDARFQLVWHSMHAAVAAGLPQPSRFTRAKSI